MDFWSLLSEAGEISFQYSANHEPTMAVLIAMKGPKFGRAEADLPAMEPNRPVQFQQKRRTSGCFSTSLWAVMSPWIVEISWHLHYLSTIVMPFSPIVYR